MKIIHCADLHLDSKMTANLDKEKAKQRKSEILITFKRMVSFAAQNDVKAILIAGDMFDTKVISASTRNEISDLIIGNSDIEFYYLKGNHDRDNFLDNLDTIPENLHLFTDSWTEYKLGDGIVRLYGVELTKENSGQVQTSFAPDPSNINIVMLHGQESESNAKDKTEVINIKNFKNKGINYLALGHIHEYKLENLDGEGKYCYPGCLEGRGFDECGDHGFVLLDVNEEKKTIESNFVSFAQRRLYTIYSDISNLLTTPEIIRAVGKDISDSEATERDLVKVVLTGTVDVECEKDIDYILSNFYDRFFFMKMYDETSIYVDYDSYMLDESLKGEFVRLVKASDLDEDTKGLVIKQGLHIIGGGKIEE